MILVHKCRISLSVANSEWEEKRGSLLASCPKFVLCHCLVVKHFPIPCSHIIFVPFLDF
uniref:Uncharacterized protein n=1 Tax=Rhizophora mucronata TaxID=61149 RepID=A0A2P2NDP0_RHIMU